MELVTINQN